MYGLRLGSLQQRTKVAHEFWNVSGQNFKVLKNDGMISKTSAFLYQGKSTAYVSLVYLDRKWFPVTT